VCIDDKQGVFEITGNSTNILVTLNEITHLPVPKLRNRLHLYQMSDAQISLIRRIRRQGLNRV
jgi:hypothetical protein